MKRYILIPFLFILTSCVKQPPLPTDHYYRLPALQGINTDKEIIDSISVINFQADGLYRERAILYSENEVEIKQYHYHHWVDSPNRLLQEYLAERLRLSNISKVVLTTFEGNSNLIIKGKIKAFEQKRLSSKNSAFVSIEFRVDRNNESQPILYKQYTQVVDSEDSSVTSAISAFGIAVNSIYESFYNDLKETIALQ
jgi:ABC-type uncharacterized transport system auxiliary subunit|tara:strand:+ start:1722 stop:2312 length:591 start_codon:yes stop_codon:yes gene_type:complete